MMFLRTKLQRYLLWSTFVFAALALVSAIFLGNNDSDADGSDDSSQDSTGTTQLITTSSYIPETYIVQPGDSLYSIAEQFSLSAPALVELNDIKNPDNVPAGTVLKLPPSTGFVPIGATTTMPP
jgi:LysM repeat protein